MEFWNILEVDPIKWQFLVFPDSAVCSAEVITVSVSSIKICVLHFFMIKS